MNRVASRWVRRLAAKVAYIGVFLSDSDRERLLKKFPPIHSQVQAHHLTIWFHTDGKMPDVNFGDVVGMKVIGYAEDDKAQVVAVQVPASLRPQGRMPHITISVSPGIPPKYAKDLVQSADGVPSFTIRGRIGWWDKDSAKFDPPNI